MGVGRNQRASLHPDQGRTRSFYSPRPLQSSAPTKISADASSYGLGAVILQQTGEKWKPVAYASRSMMETENFLYVVRSPEKFSCYVLGCYFDIGIDHKPLVLPLRIKSLDNLPRRVLRFRLACYDYSIRHVPESCSTLRTLSLELPSPKWTRWTCIRCGVVHQNHGRQPTSQLR